MGRMKQHPRYNVISLRLSDDEMKKMESAIGSGTRQNWLITAVQEKLIRDKQ